jgi:hypothetical protein
VSRAYAQASFGELLSLPPTFAVQDDATLMFPASVAMDYLCNPPNVLFLFDVWILYRLLLDNVMV